MAEGRRSDAGGPVLGDEYDAIVVGAGIGGLTCAALLAKQGYNVLVLERQETPGGFVTSYERRGYQFQVPHMIGGCGPDGDITRVMRYLGIDIGFTRIDPFMRFIYPDCEITVASDTEVFADSLKECFQPQTASINSYFETIEKVARGMDMRMIRKPLSAGAIASGLTYPFRFPRMLSMMMRGTTYSQMLDVLFTEDSIKTVLSTPWPFLGCPPWELSALSMIGMMASFADGAYMPVGGYGAMSAAFAKAVTDNGGKIMYGYEVNSINAEESRVAGVETMPRGKMTAPVVVSDADTKRTIMSLTDRENFTAAYLEKIDETPISASGLVVHLGMAKALEEEALNCGMTFVQPSYDEHEMFEELRSPTRYPDPAKLRFSMMVHSNYDRTLSPEGKSSLDVLVPAVPYRFMRRWGVEEGGVRGERYKSIKEQYAEKVVEAVGAAFPGLISDVEAYDVSTPITYERYTMAVDGCWYDSAPGPQAYLGKRHGPTTPLRGLYLAGSKSRLGGGMFASIMGGVLAADSVTRGKLSDLF